MPNYEEITNLLEKLDVINENFQRLKKQESDLSIKLIAVIYKKIKPVYYTWRPKINEQAFCVDFLERTYFRVKVISIDGYYVRLQGISSNNTAYYNAQLDDSLEEIEIPVFIIPHALFNEMDAEFTLKEIYC